MYRTLTRERAASQSRAAKARAAAEGTSITDVSRSVYDDPRSLRRLPTGPVRVRLTQPLLLWLDPTKTCMGRRWVATVADGLAALHRYGLDRHRATPAWQAAQTALQVAQADPQPAHITAAEVALQHLAQAAGALVPLNAETTLSPA